MSDEKLTDAKKAFIKALSFIQNLTNLIPFMSTDELEFMDSKMNNLVSFNDEILNEMRTRKDNPHEKDEEQRQKIEKAFDFEKFDTPQIAKGAGIATREEVVKEYFEEKEKGNKNKLLVITLDDLLRTPKEMLQSQMSNFLGINSKNDEFPFVSVKTVLHESKPIAINVMVHKTKTRGKKSLIDSLDIEITESAQYLQEVKDTINKFLTYEKPKRVTKKKPVKQGK